MPKSSPQGTGESHGELTKSHVVTVAEAALREWSAVAIGEQTKLWRSVTFELFNNLPGNALAWSIGDGNILLDVNPAGDGWFVDGTPRERSESQSTNRTLLAGPSSPAHRRMDLLTVMMHEIGDVLGCEHGADELMSATLAAGERRFEDAWSSQTENYVVIDIAERNDGTQGVIDKRSIDWKGADLEFNPLLGWNPGWTKGQFRANFPEFAYAAFDHEQPWVFEPKKRFDQASQEIDFVPQGQI